MKVDGENPFLTMVDTPCMFSLYFGSLVSFSLAGAEKEREMLLAIDSADMVIVCFDLANDDSLTRVSDYWVPLVRKRQGVLIDISFSSFHLVP